MSSPILPLPGETSSKDKVWSIGSFEPVTVTLPAPQPDPVAYQVLTKADLLAAVEALKASDAAPKKPLVYVVPHSKVAEVMAAFDGVKVESAPNQEPLFVLPPPAVPSGWTIEWRYRPDEIDWTTGRPYGETEWSHHGTWRCRMMMEKTLRRLRYSNRWRKQFRVRVTLWDYQGDIQWNGPPDPPIVPK